MNKKDKQDSVIPVSESLEMKLNHIIKSADVISKPLAENGRVVAVARSYLAGIQAIQERLEPVLNAIQHGQQSASVVKLGEQFAILSNRINAWATDPRVIENFRRGLEQFAELGQLLRRAYEKRLEYYPRLAENLDELAQQGWFIGLDMPRPVYEYLALSLERLSDEPNRIAVIDRLFVKCIQQEIESLGKKLLERHPARAFAIQPAIAAHLRGEYALSVPVFFSQAEGIVRDETERELFTKNRDKPESQVIDFAQKKRAAAKKSDDLDLSDYFEDAIWAPLCLNLPITWGSDKRENKKYTGLNRHTTLHGMDLEYASEVNSLKAFSLLCYVSSLLFSEREMQAEEGQE